LGKRTERKKSLNRDYEGYLFIAPACFLIFLFGIFPVFYTFYISLFKWRIKRGSFLGLRNYGDLFGSYGLLLLLLAVVLAIVGGTLLLNRRERQNAKHPGTGAPGLLLTGRAIQIAGWTGLVLLLPLFYSRGDDKLLDSLRVTIWYSLGTVPFQLLFGLTLSIMLNREFKGRQVFRVIYLLPYVVPSVAAATVFERLFSLRPESFANQVVQSLGKAPLQWLQEPKGLLTLWFGWGAGEGYIQSWLQGPSLALATIMIFNWWVFAGYYALIFSNGLSQIPTQLYDAAIVDGAGFWTTLRKVTIPMLSPTTFFLTMLGIIGTFKAFNQIYILRNPAARGATDPLSIQIFFTFFRKSRFGYASAMALILFGIVLALTVLQRRLMSKDVHYGN
jgi:multiple sugar transport system permease protein